MANYEYINDTGLIIPDTQDLKTTIENEFKAAFGDDLVTDGSTPQGVLISSETLARDTFIRNNAALANQINPNYAGGIFLDAIGALTNTERDKAEYSTVPMAYTGAPFTTFTNAAIFEDNVANQFSPISDVTLDSQGNGSGIARAIVPGPIHVQAGAVVKITKGVIGLETVINTADSTLGVFQQDDTQFRVKRRQTIARLGNGNILQIVSSVRAITNVFSAELVENYTSSVQVIEDITMQPHSIYVCVDGGDDDEIAEAMARKKAQGCGFTNGASNNPVSVDYVNPDNGQTYTVLFDRPNLIPILVRVTASIPNIAIDAVAIIRSAIVDYANGNIDGENGLKIGIDVTPFELAGAINLRSAGIFVRNVEITKSDNPVFSNNSIPIKKYERATIVSSSIQVSIV